MKKPKWMFVFPPHILGTKEETSEVMHLPARPRKRIYRIETILVMTDTG